MDDDYGQMFGGEEYLDEDGFDDEIIDYDDGDAEGDLDLGSEEEMESPVYVFISYLLYICKTQIDVQPLIDVQSSNWRPILKYMAVFHFLKSTSNYVTDVYFK